ncbi:hypothetical protein HS125_11345 [bacterium]|nr:hypothetical protein [bacterium]
MAPQDSLTSQAKPDSNASGSRTGQPDAIIQPPGCGGKWREPITQAVKTWSVGAHTGVERASVPMCITPAALLSLLLSVGSRRPETGAKGFGPKDRMGFAAVEFDERGCERASGAVYSPDVEWGEARRKFHLEQPDEQMMLWDGDLHSHPGQFGRPSSKSGPGLGDLGYVEEVFTQNEWMEWFFIPILTGAGTDHVVIHPWVCRRGNVHAPMLAEFVVCEPEAFPERTYNPEWLRSIESCESVGSLDDSTTVQDVSPTIAPSVVSTPQAVLLPEAPEARTAARRIHEAP